MQNWSNKIKIITTNGVYMKFVIYLQLCIWINKKFPTIRSFLKVDQVCIRSFLIRSILHFNHFPWELIDRSVLIWSFPPTPVGLGWEIVERSFSRSGDKSSIITLNIKNLGSRDNALRKFQQLTTQETLVSMLFYLNCWITLSDYRLTF